MNREQAAEVFEARRKLVAERILTNLSRSARHAHLSAFERMRQADQIALEIMNTPPDEMTDEIGDSFPGIGPDGFFIDVDGGQ